MEEAATVQRGCGDIFYFCFNFSFVGEVTRVERAFGGLENEWDWST